MEGRLLVPPPATPPLGSTSREYGLASRLAYFSGPPCPDRCELLIQLAGQWLNCARTLAAQVQGCEIPVPQNLVQNCHGTCSGPRRQNNCHRCASGARAGQRSGAAFQEGARICPGIRRVRVVGVESDQWARAPVARFQQTGDNDNGSEFEPGLKRETGNVLESVVQEIAMWPL